MCEVQTEYREQMLPDWTSPESDPGMEDMLYEVESVRQIHRELPPLLEEHGRAGTVRGDQPTCDYLEGKLQEGTLRREHHRGTGVDEESE